MAGLKKGTILRGIFSAETPDKSGEIVSIEGIDISTINDGKGLVNSEHNNDFTKTVGKILNAKKIFSDKDCSNEFEKKAYESVNKVPLMVGTVELFDEEDHPEAQAIAKIAKFYKKRNEPLVLGFSVEGGILERSGPVIKKSIVRKVAVTAGPCNEAARAELVSEMTKSEAAVFERISKTEKTQNTLSAGAVTEVLEYDEGKINESISSLKARLGSLVKALEAGFATATAPLTQGAALQKQGVKEVKPSKKIMGEETTLPGEETTKEAPEATGLKRIDENKAEKIDSKKEDAKIKFKLKKAEFIAYSFYNSLKK